MRKKVKFLLSAIVIGGFCCFSFGASHNSEASAEEIKFGGAVLTKTVKLGSEWDSESASSTGFGGYYFKATLKRFGAYTVWTTGVVEPASTNDTPVSISAYAAEPKDEDDGGCGAEFTSIEEPDDNSRIIMYSDEWTYDTEDKEDNDPKEWTYYIVVNGEVGDVVTIHFQQGAVIPSGREDNPHPISPAVKANTQARTFEENGEYYFKANLSADTLYWFGTSGGTATNALTVEIENPDVTSEDAEIATFNVYRDPAYDNDPYNDGCYVVPLEKGAFNIVVAADDTTDASTNSIPAGTPLKLSYRSYNKVGVSKHDSKLFDATTGYEADFTAGWKCTPANLKNSVYDEIIDESLFSFKAAKGARYLPRTTGAVTNLLMRVYDAGGNLVDENHGDGRSYNARCGFVAEKAGLYYIGVCRDVDDIFNETVEPTPAHIVIEQDVRTVNGSPDKYDPADDTYAGATELLPVNGDGSTDPRFVDVKGSDWHMLGSTDWYDVYKINCSAGVAYTMSISFEDYANSYNELVCDVFTMNGKKEVAVESGGDVNPDATGHFSFTAVQDGYHYVRMRTKGGLGLEFPKYRVHVKDSWGTLKVNIGGTHGAGTGHWYVDSDPTPRASGSSVYVPAGSHRLSFSDVAGLGRPATQTVTVEAGRANVSEFTVWYGDTADPGDDNPKTPEAWELSTGSTKKGVRTLWPGDEDNFSFSAVDGYYYTFKIASNNGADAVFSIYNPKTRIHYTNLTEVTNLPLPQSTTKYVLTVSRGAKAATATASTTAKPTYTITGQYRNVGAIQLMATGVRMKETVPFVTLTLKRTGSTGRIRARYGTTADTATPGEDYIACTGVVEWADRDMTPKTVTIGLLPDRVPHYEGNEKFSVDFSELEPEELSSNEYQAVFVGGRKSTSVTLLEVSKAGATEEDAYAKSYAKGATVKTEDVPLHTGTFGGVLFAKEGALTNGLPALASVTFTASNKDALSAKVNLAGKSYSFAAKAWGSKDSDGVSSVVMEQVQTVAKARYTNTLEVAVAAGRTTDPGAWLSAGGTARMVVNVPDADNKGVQEGVEYEGSLWRDNSKIQDYLTAVTNYAGYYTVALVPAGVSAADGIPYGNGFLTVTIDSKGKAKVAGQLPDGTTKPSLSATAAFDGDDLVIPVYSSKAPYCFGGELVVYNAGSDGVVATNGVKAATVRSSAGLVWNNDNAALTYGGTNGWAVAMVPVGGWYDKVASLQAYYRDYALRVDTVAISEFPKESLKTSEYSWSTDAATEADGHGVGVTGDAYTVEKAKLVKPKGAKTYDFSASVNPANVQVKVARATGMVTGGFDAWQTGVVKGAPVQQKTGVKTSGVLVFNRDPASPVGEGIDSFGYFTLKNVKIPYEVVDKKGKVSVKTRSWTFAAPFNLAAEYLGETDWWGIDLGSEPPPPDENAEEEPEEDPGL